MPSIQIQTDNYSLASKDFQKPIRSNCLINLIFFPKHINFRFSKKTFSLFIDSPYENKEQQEYSKVNQLEPSYENKEQQYPKVNLQKTYFSHGSHLLERKGKFRFVDKMDFCKLNLKFLKI